MNHELGIMNKEDKKFIYDFIHKHQIAVLSTIHENNTPESAVVEFGETEELEIIFDTIHPSYRKYKNLMVNSAVALVIGWDDDITVQYEGNAKEIKAREKEKYKKIYFSKNPQASKWDSNPEIKYFKVSPMWIRYSDYSKRPYKVIELKF